MIISNNIPAIKVHNNLNRTNRRINNSMERLSTGLKINSAAHDPSGLAVSNRIRREITGLNVVSQNALDATSIVQTADSALDEVNSILQRVRELSVQASNDTASEADRAIIQVEINQLLEEVNTIGNTTTFNGKPLFTGSFNQYELDEQGNPITDENGNSIIKHQHGKLMVRIGTGKDEVMFMDFPNLSTETLGLDNIDIVKEGNATNVISILDSAINDLSVMRANLGAYENRFTHTSSVLDATAINMQSALSRIVDTDMALEMSNLTQQNVIAQAGISILAQANQRPQQILQFLG